MRDRGATGGHPPERRPQAKQPPERHPDEQSIERAALHALGILPANEARAFEEHLASGCSACTAQTAAFRQTLGEIAKDAAGTSLPPAGLRARLLERIAAEQATSRRATSRMAASQTAAPQAPTSEGPAEKIQVWKQWKGAAGALSEPGLSIVRASTEGWEPTAQPGVRVKPLSVDHERGYVTMLVRMEAGSSYPHHRHAGVEECYVLQGELHVGESRLREGDYQRAEAGSLHGVQSTDTGCLLLIVSSQHDELL